MLTQDSKVAFKQCHSKLMKLYCVTYTCTQTQPFIGLEYNINDICTEVGLYILGSWKTLWMRGFKLSDIQVSQAWSLKFSFLNNNIRNLIFIFLWSIFVLFSEYKLKTDFFRFLSICFCPAGVKNSENMLPVKSCCAPGVPGYVYVECVLDPIKRSKNDKHDT